MRFPTRNLPTKLASNPDTSGTNKFQGITILISHELFQNAEKVGILMRLEQSQYQNLARMIRKKRKASFK